MPRSQSAALCSLLFLTDAPLARGGLFGCQQPSSNCELQCDDCPGTDTTPWVSCGEERAHCGNPNVDHSGWAEGCYKYSSIGGMADSSAGCNGVREYIFTAGALCGLVFAFLSMVAYVTWPVGRCCCNSCGGDTVYPDSCCSGQPEAARCSCWCCVQEESKAIELHASRRYFSNNCDACSLDCDPRRRRWLNPCHPRGAVFLLPAVTALLAGAATAVGMLGAQRCADVFDGMLVDLGRTVDDVVAAPAAWVDANLTASKQCYVYDDTTSGRTQRYDTVDYKDVASSITNTAKEVRTHVDSIARDTEDVRQLVKLFAWVFSALPCYAAVLVGFMAFCHCGRASSRGGTGCAINFQMFVCIFPLLVCMGLFASIAGGVSKFSKDFCEELQDMAKYPPVLSGFITNNLFEQLCKSALFMQQVGPIFTLRDSRRAAVDAAQACVSAGQSNSSCGAYAACPDFDNAVDLLRGRIARSPLRGSIYEGLVSCRRVFNVAGKALSDGTCPELDNASMMLVAGMYIGFFALTAAFASVWIGYKRWVGEDDLSERVKALPMPPDKPPGGSNAPYGIVRQASTLSTSQKAPKGILRQASRVQQRSPSELSPRSDTSEGGGRHAAVASRPAGDNGEAKPDRSNEVGTGLPPPLKAEGGPAGAPPADARSPPPTTTMLLADGAPGESCPPTTMFAASCPPTTTMFQGSAPPTTTMFQGSDAGDEVRRRSGAVGFSAVGFSQPKGGARPGGTEMEETSDQISPRPAIPPQRGSPVPIDFDASPGSGMSPYPNPGLM